MVITREQLRENFRDSIRLPSGQDPRPRPGRIIGICAWTAGLGLLGLPTAGRVLLAVSLGSGPGWYPVAAIALGSVGMLLTATAFMTIHRRRLPWLTLGAATATLAATLALTPSIQG